MRHKKVAKRQIDQDKKYKSVLVAKFINYLMKNGKKSVAEDVMYTALDLIVAKNQDALALFDKAIQNVGPKQEVKPRRVGGASYQIPTEVRSDRKVAIAMRWIIDAAKARSNKEYHTFSKKLSAELMDASNELGEAIKKRETQREIDRTLKN